MVTDFRILQPLRRSRSDTVVPFAGKDRFRIKLNHPRRACNGHSFKPLSIAGYRRLLPLAVWPGGERRFNPLILSPSLSLHVLTRTWYHLMQLRKALHRRSPFLHLLMHITGHRQHPVSRHTCSYARSSRRSFVRPQYRVSTGNKFQRQITDFSECLQRPSRWTALSCGICLPQKEPQSVLVATTLRVR